MYLAGTYLPGWWGAQLGVKTPLPIHEGASRQRLISTHDGADRCVSVSLVSCAAEESVPCRETRAGFEKFAAGIPGAVWTTRNS